MPPASSLRQPATNSIELESTPYRISFTRNHGKDSVQAVRKGTQEGDYGYQVEEAYRDVLLVHLQGSQAGPPRHWYLEEGNVHHELLHQRYL